MQVTEADVARVPVTNLRVPRADFGALWAAAERLCDDPARDDASDWYAAGVVVTCRWLATAATLGPNGRVESAYSPVTRRTARAYEELIEAECIAAEQLLVRSPIPAVMRLRPGWAEAIAATLRWAWRHQGAPPLDLEPAERANQS